MKPASVSVVIPVLNGAHTIGDTLRSLAKQTPVPARCETIVVDNGSTDGTAKLVADLGVTLLHEATPGAAAARNCGLRAATGEIVVFCDADTVPTRRWLAEMTAAFDDPAVTLAAGQIVCYPPKTGPERYLAASGVYDVERAVARPSFPLAPSGNMAVRRTAALAVGGFDETMLTAEDADFCYRVVRAYPGAIAYRAAAILFHRSRPSDAELRRQAWVYGEGVARLYLRYPEVLPWDLRRVLLVASRALGRGALPLLLAGGHLLRIVSSEKVEFAAYHRLWTWWFWCGFFRLYYARHGGGTR
ncbi:MAG TPA: glycosyltransferase [Candidatus Lustribacter sp.]